MRLLSANKYLIALVLFCLVVFVGYAATVTAAIHKYQWETYGFNECIALGHKDCLR